jgi:16S rRNA (guanine966-N2)-methyltransferase
VTGLRVIAGSARGVTLRLPSGASTRPTTGRLRESLFAMLEAAGVDFARVLDLYAGSGALGIEALSRGDGEATFVEGDRRVAEVIRDNLARARVADRAQVVVARVGRWRPREGATYTLVLADPPYGDPAYHGPAPWPAVERTIERALAPDAVVVVEHEARRAPPESLAGLPLWRDRRQGAGAVAIYGAALPRGEGDDE